MAKRAKNVPTVDVDALVKVFVTLASLDQSEDQPVTVQEMADELEVSTEIMFENLDNLADAELIEFERGAVWISREGVTADNAEDIAVNALNGFEPKSEERKRLEYATRAAESQDGVMSQAPEHSGKAVAPAEVPVIAADGTAVTVPVDPENDPKGPRRELDAAKGEKLIAEETITVKVAPKPAALPEIDGLAQFVDAETGDMVYESRNERDGLVLPEPEKVEACPPGVNHNVWDLAHTANTKTARAYWMRQVNAVLHNQAADAPF